jgi:hypothetical protein
MLRRQVNSKAYQKAFIPPPPPPKTCQDLVLIERQITAIIDWIGECTPGPFDKTIEEFLLEFHYNPEISRVSWKTSRSFDYLFFQKQVQEIDVFFEQCRIWLQDWQVLLASFGRTGEVVGNALKSNLFEY